MMNDTIADFLARMQNGIMREKKEVVVLKTKMIVSILEILKKEGMILDFEILEDSIVVKPLYNKREAVVSKFKRISKSGQRIYINAKEIVPIMNGRGISIISTSQGLLTGSFAKSKKLGGEHICNIW